MDSSNVIYTCYVCIIVEILKKILINYLKGLANRIFIKLFNSVTNFDWCYSEIMTWSTLTSDVFL